jgi:hypothetical protein
LYVASWTNSIPALQEFLVLWTNATPPLHIIVVLWANATLCMEECTTYESLWTNATEGLHEVSLAMKLQYCHLIHEVYDFALKSVVCASVDKCHTTFCTRVCNIVDKCRTVFAQRPWVIVSHPSCSEVGQMPHLVCNSQNLKSCGQMPHQICAQIIVLWTNAAPCLHGNVLF